MLDTKFPSKQNTTLNRFSDILETEITEEDNEELSINDSKLNQSYSRYHQRLLTYENNNTESNIKICLTSTKESQTNYWLKIKKCNTMKNHNSNEFKEQRDKLNQLKKKLKDKEKLLKEKLNIYNDIKKNNSEIKKIILIEIISMNS